MREDAIIASVNRLLAEKGFDLMTVDEVAADVGIAKASLYKHFASKEALAAAEKEATRRMGRGMKKKEVESMAILERGLWERLPAEVWAMELRLSDKQGVELRLTSPDEPEARASYEAEHPEEVARRAQVMASLDPPELDLDDDPEDDDADASDDDANDDGDEA